MKKESKLRIDTETLESLGLQVADTPLTAEPFVSGQVYKYQRLDNVYIMETDLYGNDLPEGSCFLAFEGHHGLIGKPLKLEKLKSLSPADIEKMVSDNKES